MARRVTASGKVSKAGGRKATGSGPALAINPSSKLPDLDLREQLDQAIRELTEAHAQQTATAEVLKVISRETFDLPVVLDRLIAAACRLCDGDIGTIRYEDGPGYGLAATYGCQPEWHKHFAGYSTKPNRASVFGQTILKGSTVHILDVLQDPDYARPEAQKLMNLRAALGVPLVRDGRVFGVVNLFRTTPGPFTQKQIELAETFADQAVIAIENVRLYNETKEALEQQQASADILSVISNSVADAQPVFDKILVSCKHLFGGDELDVLLVDEQGQLNIAAYIGDSHDVVAATFPAPVERTPAGHAIRERRVMHWPDLVDGEDVPGVLRKMAKLIGYRSMVFAPMLWEGRGIGAIGVARSTGPFKSKELAMIETFADQAVIAIQNARMFNETKEALERQTATADILKVIASSPSDVQPVFDAIAERSKRLVDALSTTVFRLENSVMHLWAFTPTNPEADATLKAMFPAPLSGFSWSKAIGNGEIYRVLDTDLEVENLRELARLRGFRSMLFVPLLRDRKPIGVIAVTRVEPGPFVEHHVNLLQTFADQAVIAIENVRLFDAVQAKTNDLTEALQQQTATADVLKVISRSAFELQTVLDTLTESAARLCNADMAAIVRQHPDGNGYYHATNYNFSPDWLEITKSMRLHPGRGSVVGRALLESNAVQVADVLQDSEYAYSEMQKAAGYRTLFGVPLLRAGQPIGVLFLGRRAVDPFSDKQIDLVRTFADQAVIAIENVRLFDQVQSRTDELARSLDELRTAQDRLVQTEKLASLGQLTAGIAHEIKNPLNFVNNFSALSTDLIDELNDALKPAALDDKVRVEVDELTQMLKGNLEKVVQHGRRADSIVKNMLLHSREGSGERRAADINAIVEESLNLAYHGARAEKPGFNITLQRDLDHSAGMIDLYPQEITRVLLNLISNGFYAATKRKLEAGDGFEPMLIAATKNLGSKVEIRIRDNGTGIPPDVKERMFNPFFTTKPAGEGTGLGLSMSHDIVVKQHGGKIDVETEPGQFTEFLIVLPRLTATN